MAKGYLRSGLQLFGASLAAIVLGVIVSFLIMNWQRLGRSPDKEHRDQVLSASKFWYDNRFVGPLPLKNNWRGSIKESFKSNPYNVPADDDLSLAHITKESFAQKPYKDLRVTWLGHSTVILEIEGATLLIDPIWSERPSPTKLLGPKRWYDPLIDLDDLPPIDAVIISHDHYDHLDYDTIKAMEHWNVRFIVPLGVGAHLKYWGIKPERIKEIDWWESFDVKNVTITATPARHTSGRLWPIGADKTLWAGFAFKGKNRSVWYSGDSGLFPGIREIGQRLGPFDLTMIDIGQYNANWPDWHMGPEQAVKAHIMAGGETLMGVHWGLFNLARHSWTEPIERLLTAGHQEGVDILLPRPGELAEPHNLKAARTPWWPKVPRKTAAEDPIISSGCEDIGW